MQQRFVWMPYLPIVVIGIVAILYVALTPRPTTAPSASTSKSSSFHSLDGREADARLRISGISLVRFQNDDNEHTGVSAHAFGGPVMGFRLRYGGLPRR
jgi:hypothetical protein